MLKEHNIKYKITHTGHLEGMRENHVKMMMTVEIFLFVGLTISVGIHVMEVQDVALVMV